MVACNLKNCRSTDLPSVAYDVMGNRTYRANEIKTGKDEFYTYDDANRLVAMDRGTLNQPKTGIAGTPVYEENYTLDRLGNWATWTIAEDGETTLSQNRTHNAANETTALAGVSTHIAHDRAGNMTKMPTTEAFNQHYHLKYDAWNRVVKIASGDTSPVTLVEYQYDGEHRRIWKKADGVEWLFYYSHDWQLLGELRKVSALASFVPYAQYIWGLRYIDDLILRDADADDDPETGHYGQYYNQAYSGFEQRIYALQDANWNVFSVVNTSGEVVERYVYDPYGRATICDSSWNPRTPQSSQYAWSDLFTGRRLDVETGLYHYRYRQYHPTLGRFVNRDPIGYEGGVNLYEYVGNHPIIGIDPLGLQDPVNIWPNPDYSNRSMNCMRCHIPPEPECHFHGNLSNAFDDHYFDDIDERPITRRHENGWWYRFVHNRFYKWLYTGNPNISDADYDTCLNAAAGYILCYLDCVADVNKHLLALAGGVTVAATEGDDYLPIFKWFIQQAGLKTGGFGGGFTPENPKSLLTCWARVKAANPNVFPITAEEQIMYRNTVNAIKHSSSKPLAQARACLRQGAKSGIAAAAVIEIVIEAYCADTCYQKYR